MPECLSCNIQVTQEAYDWVMRPDSDDEVPSGLRAIVLEQRAGEVRRTTEEARVLDLAYDHHQVTHRYTVDNPADPTGKTVVLVVNYTGRGWGYDVWVGNLDSIQNLGGTATEWSALWYASNWAPEAQPAA